MQRRKADSKVARIVYYSIASGKAKPWATPRALSRNLSMLTSRTRTTRYLLFILTSAYGSVWDLLIASAEDADQFSKARIPFRDYLI